jgi:hypothetical protein
MLKPRLGSHEDSLSFAVPRKRSVKSFSTPYAARGCGLSLFPNFLSIVGKLSLFCHFSGIKSHNPCHARGLLFCRFWPDKIENAYAVVVSVFTLTGVTEEG